MPAIDILKLEIATETIKRHCKGIVIERVPDIYLEDLDVEAAYFPSETKVWIKQSCSDPWLLLHEIAHYFCQLSGFADTKPEPIEEAVCDAFASYALGDRYGDSLVTAVAAGSNYYGIDQCDTDEYGDGVIQGCRIVFGYAGVFLTELRTRYMNLGI